jgi:hypothetical protein
LAAKTDILPFDKPSFIQALTKRRPEMDERFGRRAAEKPDYRHRPAVARAPRAATLPMLQSLL